MEKSKLSVTGQLVVDEYCHFWLEEPKGGNALVALLLDYYSPNTLDENRSSIMNMLSQPQPFPVSEAEQRDYLKRFNQELDDAVFDGGLFRITFKPLSDKRQPLVLEGSFGVDEFGSDFWIEGSETAGELVTLFLRHFYPGEGRGEGPEEEDDCSVVAGLFEITFEPLSDS
jgi:hypothetical protein